MKHEDNRRTLVEFGNNGVWKLCKVLMIKQDCVLGKHYHKEKVESFLLVKGEGKIKLGGDLMKDMEVLTEYFVPKNISHEFLLRKDSILIGLCSKEFNIQDDYK